MIVPLQEEKSSETWPSVKGVVKGAKVADG